MHILILAGGSGTRLWPLSRLFHPKQLLKIEANHSFLQQTYLRFSQLVSPKEIHCITSYRNYYEVLHQLQEIDPTYAAQVLMEPSPRNTAPAIALGMRYLEEQCGANDEITVIVSPSDHVIEDASAFSKLLKQAKAETVNGSIVILGVPPTRAETGYGYIKKGNKQQANGTFVVEHFCEKPSQQLAEEYAASQNYLWNAGILLFRIGDMWQTIKDVGSSLYSLRSLSFRDALAAFSSLPSEAIDTEVLEKANNLNVLPLPITWSDVGTWDSLYDLLKKDEAANVTTGKTALIESHGNLIIGSNRLIAAIALDKHIVIDTQDALLVAQRGASQQVKTLVNHLKKEAANTLSTPSTLHRPWGYYTILENHSNHQLRRLTVLPKSYLKPQMHHYRNEHWIVLSGSGEAKIGEMTKELTTGSSAYIQAGERHQLTNLGDDNLEVIEIQVGAKIDEEDIIRYESFASAEPISDKRDELLFS